MRPTLNTYQWAFFLESQQVLLQHGLEFSLSSYQL
jgi:hypothetical protein